MQIPFAHRGDNLDVRIKHEDARLEAHLVVALARAAVRDVLRAELVRRVHKVLGDQRPGQRGHERVLVLCLLYTSSSAMFLAPCVFSLTVRSSSSCGKMYSILPFHYTLGRQAPPQQAQN